MRRSMLPILLSLALLPTACSRGGDAADASPGGNSAEALKQMGD